MDSVFQSVLSDSQHFQGQAVQVLMIRSLKPMYSALHQLGNKLPGNTKRKASAMECFSVNHHQDSFFAHSISVVHRAFFGTPGEKPLTMPSRLRWSVLSLENPCCSGLLQDLPHQDLCLLLRLTLSHKGVSEASEHLGSSLNSGGRPSGCTPFSHAQGMRIPRVFCVLSVVCSGPHMHLLAVGSFPLAFLMLS